MDPSGATLRGEVGDGEEKKEDEDEWEEEEEDEEEEPRFSVSGNPL